ncbi:hypothetical protein LTS18_007941, partial [Coniosporium uncinatum]
MIVSPSLALLGSWTTSYYSRPGLTTQVINYTVYDNASISHDDGHIFLSPTVLDPVAASTLKVQNAAVIYNVDGSLLYSSYDTLSTPHVANVDVQQYKGKPHLTWFKGNDAIVGNRGNVYGRGFITDQSYQHAGAIRSDRNLIGMDDNVLLLTPHGTAIVSVQQPARHDLRKYGIPGDLGGWVTQTIFQEFNITMKQVLFQWNSLDHVPMNESGVEIGTGDAGNGTTMESSYDYFHGTSVALTRD